MRLYIPNPVTSSQTCPAGSGQAGLATPASFQLYFKAEMLTGTTEDSRPPRPLWKTVRALWPLNRGPLAREQGNP